MAIRTDKQRRAVMRKYRISDPSARDIDTLVRDEDGTYIYMPPAPERKRLMRRTGLTVQQYKDRYGKKMTARQYQDRYGRSPDVEYSRYASLGATHVRRPRRLGDYNYGI